MSKSTNARPVKIDQLAEEVMKQMHEYVDLADEGMKKSVRKTATAVKKEISTNAPKRTGQYAKSWTIKTVNKNSHKISSTVYSKSRMQLSHLLEDGHDYVSPDGERIKNAAQPYEHIKPARDKGEKMLVELIKKEL
ncbi:MAG: HK97 gp10 family phage protein [Prevotella sp.]|nr:HK97 gp10 family phage protein [Alistipes senegalensis]MCM1357015.1 HK97 gp10 family phage protein [Prevotella sp.]MCM1472614.1 HK97 gp10 family phage protein [Muribaculaceae bacterium]